MRTMPHRKYEMLHIAYVGNHVKNQTLLSQQYYQNNDSLKHFLPTKVIYCSNPVDVTCLHRKSMPICIRIEQ